MHSGNGMRPITIAVSSSSRARFILFSVLLIVVIGIIVLIGSFHEKRIADSITHLVPSFIVGIILWVGWFSGFGTWLLFALHKPQIAIYNLCPSCLKRVRNRPKRRMTTSELLNHEAVRFTAGAHQIRCLSCIGVG